MAARHASGQHQSHRESSADLLPATQRDWSLQLQLRELSIDSGKNRRGGLSSRRDDLDKQSVYARFSRKNITADFANPLLPDDSDSIHNRSLLVSHAYAITSHLVNEFRFGFTNVTTSTGFPILGADALSQLQLTGVNISQHPTTDAFPTFNFSAGTGFTPIGRDKTGVTQSKTTQFTDNLSYNWRKHTFKAGVDLRRVRYADIETFLPSDDFGQFTFSTDFHRQCFR